jgi:hypothetical protein
MKAGRKQRAQVLDAAELARQPLETSVKARIEPDNPES